MMIIALFLILIGAIYFPQWWVKHTIQQHAHIRQDIPGTGAEFAQHLLNQLDLDDINVEESDGELSDHYSSEEKVVRLSPNHFHQHSLSAIVIAAHEVGHAIQDAENHTWMIRRHTLAKLSQVIETIAPIALTISPLLFALTKSPILSMATVAIGALSIGISTLFHFATLPVEFDASFNKALPILEQGHYLNTEDMQSARKILKAAALTYVAQSLMNILNVGYWLKRIKRF